MPAIIEPNGSRARIKTQEPVHHSALRDSVRLPSYITVLLADKPRKQRRHPLESAWLQNQSSFLASVLTLRMKGNVDSVEEKETVWNPISTFNFWTTDLNWCLQGMCVWLVWIKWLLLSPLDDFTITKRKGANLR